MNKTIVIAITGAVMLGAASFAMAGSWGSVLKSAAQSAGQAAVQQLCPQAQTTVDEANKLGAGAPQEDFIMTKAKEFLAAGNYQTALDLANYVITTLNSKSIDAQKIMADAKAAIKKMAQDNLAKDHMQASAAGQGMQAQVHAAQQIKADADQTVNGVKGLLGTQK